MCMIFATVEICIGMHAPAVWKVFHFKYPTSLEKYLQEIGRAGRNELPADEILYVNKTDVRKTNMACKTQCANTVLVQTPVCRCNCYNISITSQIMGTKMQMMSCMCDSTVNYEIIAQHSASSHMSMYKLQYYEYITPMSIRYTSMNSTKWHHSLSNLLHALIFYLTLN